MNLKDKVQALFDSDISDYRISKDTGVSQPTVTRYHNGTSELDSMSLGTAQKLSRYWDAAMIDVALKDADSDDPRLRNFKDRLVSFGQEMVDEQLEMSQTDEAYPEDKAMAEVLRMLFNDAIGDNTEIGRLLAVYAKHLK